MPTLRNVGVSLPYLHNGSMGDLYKVVEHYRNIDTTNKMIDPLLRKKINITEKEKQQLVLFLYTLTDTSFTKNKRFSY